MKKEYIAPENELIRLEMTDVITISIDRDEDELPPVPAGF